MNLGLMPAYLLREWTSDGKPLSGGTLSFYQSGTFVPKAVYADAEGAVSLGSVITLDASGSAVIFMGQGPYRIWLKNSVGSQVAPYVDGVVASGSGLDVQSTLNVAFVKNYDELRQLTGDIDTVYVAGRVDEGDGGEGLFQLDPTDISVDNDGTILVTTLGQNVFKRIFDGYLDCRWFGVTYGSGESYYSLVSALSASAALNIPLLIAGAVYVSQELTVPNGASVEFTDGAFLISGGSAINVTFATGSHLHAVSRIFGTNILPKIGKGVCDKLPISWMAGQVDDDRFDKLLLASTDPAQIVEIDESISVLATTWMCVNQLRFTFGSIVTFTGTGDLNWTSKNILPIPFKTFAITETDTYVFNFGSNFAYPEMFGAVGDGVTNDSIAFGLATFATNVELLNGRTYKLNSILTKNNVFNIKGGGILDLGSSTDLDADTLTITDIGIVKVEDFNTWFTGTNFFATNCTFPSNYSVSGAKSISNCSYVDDTRYPVLDGTVGPAIYNAHLPLIPGSAILGTDTNGKIKNNAESNYKFNGGLWDCISGFGAYGRKMSRIRYVHGRYWILGTAGYLGVSDDAITWTRITIPNTTDILQDLIWNGTYYILSSCLQGDGTDNYSIYRSLDGVNWTGGKIYNPAWMDESGTFQLSFVNNQLKNIAYNGATIVVGAANGYVLVSYDHGATFNPLRIAISNAYTGASWIGYITGQWVFGDGNGNWYYNDELVYNSFTKVGSGTTIDKVLLMHWNGSTYKVIYSYGAVGTYTDLDRGGASDNWTVIPQGPHSFNDAYTANGLYVMAGASGIATYYEGVDAWTPRNVPGVELINDSVGTPGVGCGGSPNGELFIISDRYVFRTT